MVGRVVVVLLLSFPAVAGTFPIVSVERPAYLKDIQISGTPAGILHAAWIEGTETAVGQASAWSAAYDREGQPLGAHPLPLETQSVSGIAIASNASATLIAWKEYDRIRAAYVNDDGSIAGEPFVIAKDQKSLEATPTIAAAPDQFVVAWLQDGRAVAARVTGSTVGAAKTIAVSPPPEATFTWSMRSVSIAVGETVGVVATYFRPLQEPLPWPTPYMVRINRFGPEGEIPPAELRSGGYEPDVATDGRAFLAVWSEADAVHGLVMREDGSTDDTLVFTRPTGGAKIEWNGATYSGAWGYYLFGGIPHLSMAEISPEGTVIGPLHVADTETSPYPGRVAVCGGESVVAWLEGRSAVGEFVRGTRLVTIEVADRPAITVARCCDGMLKVCWQNYGFVDEMWVEIVSALPFQTRVHEDRKEKNCGEYPLRYGDAYVRVRALNAAGGSHASVLPIPPARPRALHR